jgi:hypothetical protein
MESFLALYTKISKEQIRRNSDNVGERLEFLGRVIHGTNPRAWLNEMCQRLGEKIKSASIVAGDPHIVQVAGKMRSVEER